MHHNLKGRWGFECVTGRRGQGKGAFRKRSRRNPAPQKVCLKSLALFGTLLLCFPAFAAVDRSILKAQEGSSAILRGRFDLAISAFDDALKDPSLSPARQATLMTDRGVAKWRLRQLDAALADFTKAIALNRDYAPAYNNRGTVLMDLNRPDEAYKDFERAIALSPSFGAAFANRANANQK